MIRLRILGTALALMATPLQAQGLQPPKGKVILTIGGKITQTNGGGVARFDVELLESLPQYSFSTTTIWTKGANTYSGVHLKDLLARVGATGKVLEIHALNDYWISIPVADVSDDAPLLAYRMDGQTIPVREKGPVWLIYPFDLDPVYRTEATYSRAVWQLVRIEVTD